MRNELKSLLFVISDYFISVQTLIFQCLPILKEKETNPRVSRPENWLLWQCNYIRRLPLSDIINVHYSMHISVVVRYHGLSEPFLTSCVPQLQLEKKA